jgi:dTDP-4-amino-4,6-dideoxy-D-galactose acyltransferase
MNAPAVKIPYLPIGLGGEEKLEKSVVPLPWDSQHFEIPIARIIPPELNDSELRSVLSFAKSEGFHLVYWATRQECALPPTLLMNFLGLLVDRKVTFQKKLMPDPISDSVEKLSSPLKVLEYTQSQATDLLLSLAVQSGIHSRFNVDPHIPKYKFESMFHIWMKRSVVHDLADVVFVAVHPSNIHQYLGVITASVEYGMGKIGLISVLPNYQGKGIGSLLMRAVHQWMHSHDINETVVVTQQDNIAACKLYARLGYRLESLQHFYHFWVQK